MKFGIDSDGNYGYIKAGADTVTPFKKGGSLISQREHGGSATINLNNGNYLVCISSGIGNKISNAGSLSANFNCSSELLFSSMLETYNDKSFTHRSNFSVFKVTVTDGTLTITPTSGSMAYAIISSE